MRIRAGDPHHDWTNAFVSVDGVQISCCVEADTVEGWADITATDDAGHILTDGDQVKLVRMRGDVAVTFRPAP